jgi:mono/diheme cytochrome c family protein
MPIAWLAVALPAASPAAAMPPIERAESTEQGTLKNPYTDDAEAITAGKKLFLSYSCNGCHGGTGGGGMGPPLSNEVWVYGSDDDTLFRLVAYGSDELQHKGYSRKSREGVVGPMPPQGEIIDSDDELWKILAFVRTVYKGDPKRRNW